MEFNILDQDKVIFVREGYPELEFTGKQLKEEAPEWTGTYAIGDIIHADGEELRILELQVEIPDEGNTVTIYKLTIGKHPL